MIQDILMIIKTCLLYLDKIILKDLNVLIIHQKKVLKKNYF